VTEPSGAPRPVVCVFAKAPRAGAVKTRLAADVGPALAARFATAFLEDTCAALGTLPLCRVLATTEEKPPGELAAETWLQGGGELGERLERMLKRALETAPWAMAIGADSPGFPLDAIVDAGRRLRSIDAVFGPADDGGFYFVALRSCPSGAFAGVRWSCPDTLRQAERRLRELGLTTARAEPWFDVDTLTDLRRLAALIDSGRVTAPATARVLATHVSADHERLR
jgi:uncharacterized protein